MQGSVHKPGREHIQTPETGQHLGVQLLFGAFPCSQPPLYVVVDHCHFSLEALARGFQLAASRLQCVQAGQSNTAPIW